jgi:hypothetical protein
MARGTDGAITIFLAEKAFEVMIPRNPACNRDDRTYMVQLDAFEIYLLIWKLSDVFVVVLLGFTLVVERAALGAFV